VSDAPRVPVLGVTAGDPAGIGPEIVARSLASGELGHGRRIVVFAQSDVFAEACRQAGADPPPRWEEAPDAPVALSPAGPEAVPDDFRPGRSSEFGGRAAAAALEASVEAALTGRVDAIVTAPLSKVSLAAAGVEHPGHTEYLAELTGAERVAMMFVAGGLRLTLATIHVRLADVPSRLSTDGLLGTMRLTRDALTRHLELVEPRLAVLGLNPHAGEEGRFGDEEARVIGPAIEQARERGWTVHGPFAADSFFLRQRSGYDAVVAMYHDQGLIPVKLLSEGRAVNVTLGLPFVRTSVDHGTAFDIAGRGVASPDSLLEAARVASEWC